MVKFLIFLGILTVLMGITVYAAHEFGNFPLPTFYRAILIYMFCTTITAFYILGRNLPPALFTQAYLISIVMKMITGGAFIFLIIFIDPAGARVNATLFIVSYLLFTALEVGFLYRNINIGKSKS
ncbi:MAG TPA: hypothetical protein PLR06_01565 [Cyclobacteriaceae bacterium]|nr:hypothetical protein [Cyclobacteriaceae bacterium]